MNPPMPHISGGAESAINPEVFNAPSGALFDADAVAAMQAEMQRLMRDYPDGNIPAEKIAEWEAMAEQERLGHEPDDLAASIAADEAADETAHKMRKPRAARIPRDTPPADMEPDAQDSTDIDTIKLNRADTKLAINVGRLYAVIGLGVHVLNETDGLIIISASEQRAKELVLLSNHHPALKKALRTLTESNDYITFAFGHGGMALMILQAHGIMPRDIATRLTGMFRRPAPIHQG